MPTLDDIPTLATVTPSGEDLLPIYDPVATGSSKVRKIALNQINGLTSSTDVTGPAVLSNATALTTRLTMNSSGTTALLPAASGVMRDVIIMNGNAGAGLVVTSGATNIYTSATSGCAVAASATIPASTTGRFLSDGTSWYRTH
jgi:hypothetical protein